MSFEKDLKELEAKSRSLKWVERNIGPPHVTRPGWGGSARLHQFTAIDNKRQIFVYKTILTPPEWNDDQNDSNDYGLAIFHARKSMADYFQPSGGITIWEGSFACPNSEGLIAHYEEYDEEDGMIRLLHEKLRIINRN